MLGRLEKRREQGNLRRLSKHEGLIDFSSNDYLGLACSEELHAAVGRESEAFQCTHGSTGSRLLTGNTAYAEELERKISLFHGSEAALLFACGYMANIGLLSTVAQEEDTILYDLHVHASTYDGMRLSKGRCIPLEKMSSIALLELSF